MTQLHQRSSLVGRFGYSQYFAPTARQIVPSIRAYLGDDFRARPFSISNWTPGGRRVSEYLYGAVGGAHTGDALVTTPVLGNHPGEYRGVMRWAHGWSPTSSGTRIHDRTRSTPSIRPSTLVSRKARSLHISTSASGRRHSWCLARRSSHVSRLSRATRARLSRTSSHEPTRCPAASLSHTSLLLTTTR